MKRWPLWDKVVPDRTIQALECDIPGADNIILWVCVNTLAPPLLWKGFMFFRMIGVYLIHPTICS